MLRIRQVKEPLNHQLKDLVNLTAQKLKIKPTDIINLKINKKSLDARNKENIYYVYEVDIAVNNEKQILKKVNKDVLLTPNENYQFNITGTKKLSNRPIIVGSGPAGLFCAYLLAQNGYEPLIIERGEKIEDRIKTVNQFWKTGKLNLESNVQFGEGGAGTFSDGKLNTLTKDKTYRYKKVIDIFIENGAPKEIGYLNKPHIGTDLLKDVIINMRKFIIKNGGEIYYNTCLTDLIIENNTLKAIEVNNSKTIICDNLILAIGHSARDTFKMLYGHHLEIVSKPFAVGIRIEHPQTMINYNQYGFFNNYLPNADYKLTYTTSKKRGVYSFCMCPGGYVVNASSEKGLLAINGMSNHNRNSINANSAIIVTVSQTDYGSNPLYGIEFQKNIEQKAYNLGKGKIPIQLFKDFVNNQKSTQLGKIKPVFKGEYTLTNLNEIYPSYINEALKEAILAFDNKIKGFARDDAILAGGETRTSSPVRIKRDNNFMTNIKGIYPIGEGSGYTGGITTSAIDGIKMAEIIASIYQKRK